MVPVYFVVPAGLVLLDLAGPAEAFRIANKLRPGSFALHYCGPEPEVECGLAGLHLSRLAPLPASLPAQALVVVPGVVDAAFQLDRPPLRRGGLAGALPRAGPLRPDVGLLGRAARRRGRAAGPSRVHQPPPLPARPGAARAYRAHSRQSHFCGG